MANYANLLATIAANIYTNNNNEVTAAMVKSAVDQMVASLGAGYQFMGVATPATNPGTPDAKVFYFASEPGTYTNFGGIIVNEKEVAILYGSGSSWFKSSSGAANAAYLDLVLNGDEIEQPTLDEVISGNLRANGKWGIYGTTASLIIDISKYRGKKITAVSSIPTKQYAFLSDFGGAVHDAQSTFCAGCSRVEDFPTNEEIPADCNYIYLLVQNTGSIYLPNITISDTHKGLLQAVSDLKRPKKCVVWDGTKFAVYQQLHNSNFYTMLEIVHDVDHSDLVYADLWRLKTNGGIFEYVNDFFASKNIKLLHNLENEFAFKYVGTADFTGGFHGDERIDQDASCYVKFYIDGIELTAADLSNPFTIWCNTFRYEQRSTLHQTSPTEGQYVAGHPMIAYHLKDTIFEDGGYKTTNRLDIDLSNTSLASIVTDTIFTGLACIHKDTASSVIVDTGNEIVTSADAQMYDFDGISYPLSILLLYNGFNDSTGASSEVTSKELTKPESGHNTLTIWDRVNDTKYYGYAPNRTFVTGDIFVSEMKVTWDYKE